MTSTAPGRIVESRTLSQTHLLDLLVGEHADDDNVGVRAHVGQVRHRLGAEFTHSSPLLDRPPQRTNLVACLDKSAHHGPAHAPGPDKPALKSMDYPR
jgi:hypothetical protein